MSALKGNILTPLGFVAGAIEFDDAGRIARIEGEPVTSDKARESKQPLLLPGFVDLHVHGGGGSDIMEGGDAAAKVAAWHAVHGTTSLLATTMTAPIDDLKLVLTGLRPVFAGRPRNAARLLGVHLEGPYINGGKLGAQPDFARPFNPNELKWLNDIAPIRLITVAPEVPGNMEAVEALVAGGYKVQIGHTLGTYEDGIEALARGARGFTHLFNAMTGLHHREPGMVGAALANAHYSEIIPDLLHVHRGAIRVALRSIPCLYCVTDSTAAAGMPDGQYKLGRHTVTKCLGGVRLPDGTLAGSTLTMDQALRNLVNELGLDLPDVSRRVSTYAADYLGANDRGRLAPGAWGDIVVLDRDLHLTDVYIEGASIELTHAC